MQTKTRKPETPKQFNTATGLKITVDPLDAFSGISRNKLFEATGLIPYFVAEAHLSIAEEPTAQGVMDDLNDSYGFGLGEYNMLDDEAASMAENGLYSYEEDPDLSPLVEFDLGGATVWVYQYALVAVKVGSDVIMQRMD